MAEFDVLCKWYEENRKEIFLLYPNQIVLIYNNGVRGVYESYKEAYDAGVSIVG